MLVDIRTPTPNQAAQLADVFGVCVAAGFPRLPQQAISSYQRPWSEPHLQHRIMSGQDLLRIAMRHEKIVGLVSGTAPEGGLGTIIWLLVIPEAHGQGIGTALFAAACDYYRSIGAHKFKLTAPTAKARDFYLKLGMKQEGFHPQHWWEADFWSLGCIL
jgi:GNAT superfamily N-acetyltransferase